MFIVTETWFPSNFSDPLEGRIVTDPVLTLMNLYCNPSLEVADGRVTVKFDAAFRIIKGNAVAEDRVVVVVSTFAPNLNAPVRVVVFIVLLKMV